MAVVTIAHHSPFPRRLLAWAGERFPLANVAAAVLVWAAACAWGRALAQGATHPFGWRDLTGALGAIGFFLMLRVFDEHKDYAADCIAFAHRVLQRGVVTLDHLKYVGAAAIAAQVGSSLLVERHVGPATLVWFVVLSFALLMEREFFVGAWLRQRLVAYAALHMLALPLAVYWLVLLGAGEASLPVVVWLLPVSSYLTGFAFEMARKLRAPADERDHVDSYTRTLGTRRAPIVLGLVVTGTCVGFGLLVTTIAAAGWIRYGALLVIGLALVLGWRAALRFRRDPSPRTAKSCESTIGLVVGLVHLTLVCGVLLSRAGS